MNRLRSVSLITIAISFAGALGCGQYRGYEVERAREIGRSECVVRQGKPRELEVEILETDNSSLSVNVVVNAVTEDEVARVVTTEEKRIRRRAVYHPLSDWVAEPASWGLGVLAGPLGAIQQADWRYLCKWPPIDLLARICGNYGINYGDHVGPSDDSLGLCYAEHAPGYPRRLAQWFAFVLPGYTFGLADEMLTETRETVQQDRCCQLPSRLTKSPVPKARATLQTSAVPHDALQAETNSSGRASFDLSQQLSRSARDRPLKITATVKHAGLSGSAERTLVPEALDVTRDKPLPSAGLASLPEPKKRPPIPSLDLLKGEHYALLIGIENYQDDSIGDLSYSIDDVTALRDTLISHGQLKPDNTFLMTDGAENANDLPLRLNILATLKWLAENLKPQDMLIFAFAGHGETDRNVNFLIPRDGRLALPRDSSIPLTRLLQWLDACPARQQVVLLDACHSGMDARKRGRGLGGLAEAFEEELASASTEGRAILSSCSGGEIAYEDPECGHGIFTYHLLEGLKGGADSDGDDKVTVRELNLFVRPRVADWCRQNRKSPVQKPRAKFDDTAGEIVLTVR